MDHTAYYFFGLDETKLTEFIVAESAGKWKKSTNLELSAIVIKSTTTTTAAVVVVTDGPVQIRMISSPNDNDIEFNGEFGRLSSTKSPACGGGESS